MEPVCLVAPTSISIPTQPLLPIRSWIERLQAMLGPLPGGFLRFFVQRFPLLLMSIYCFALQHLGEEPHLQHYWPGGAAIRQPFLQVCYVCVHAERGN